MKPSSWVALCCCLALNVLSVPQARCATSADYIARGRTLLQEAKYSEAAQYFGAAVRRDDPRNAGNAQPYYYLGFCYYKMGRTEDARNTLNAVTTQFPHSPDAPRAVLILNTLPAAAATAQPAKSAASTVANTGVTVRSYSAPTTSGGSLPDSATVFFQKDDARLLVDTQLNNRQIKMAFDTGGTTIVVGINQLEALGIKPPTGRPNGEVGGSSNSAEQPYWLVPMEVKLGTIYKPSFPVMVLRNNATSALIGPDFLREYNYTVDRTAGAIRLSKKTSAAALAATGGAVPVPFTWEGDKIVVTVDVNGHPYKMWFDTGNSASPIAFNPADLKPLGLNRDEDSVTTHTGVTGSGASYNLKVARLRLGPIEKYNVDCTCNAEESACRPLVGQGLLEGWQYTIDDQNKVIRFLRR